MVRSDHSLKNADKAMWILFVCFLAMACVMYSSTSFLKQNPSALAGCLRPLMDGKGAKTVEFVLGKGDVESHNAPGVFSVHYADLGIVVNYDHDVVVDVIAGR